MRLFLSFLLASSLLVASSAESATRTLGAGVADAHDGDPSSVLDFSLRWKSSGRFKLISEHEVLVGWIGGRDVATLQRNALYAGYGFRSNFGRWFTGGGIVAVDNTSEALSSWYQFATTGGVHIGRATLTLRHLSNSGFRGRNRGETFLTLGFSW